MSLAAPPKFEGPLLKPRYYSAGVLDTNMNYFGRDIYKSLLPKLVKKAQ